MQYANQIDFTPHYAGIIAAAMVAALVGATAASAAELKVPKKYETIQAAVDAASNGDTILVKAGTYAENVVIDGFNGLKCSSCDLI